MKSRSEIIEQLKRPGIVAVVRAPSSEHVIPLSEALLAGGVNAVEITMSTPGAIEGIRQARQQLPEKALVGVGSVTDTQTCRAALDAGAEFVVSPILRTELVPIAHEWDRPTMIGAFTPTEAQLAHEAESDFVKIFPAEVFGARYIKSIRAPLPHLRIVPTGGVNVDTVKDFLDAGCAALGVGSALVAKDLLEQQDWQELTRRAKAFVEAVNQAKQ